MNTRAAAVMFVLFLAAVVGWGMYLREHKRVVAFVAIEDAKENLKNAAANFQPALFVSATNTAITYQVPVQTTTADGTFVNYDEKTSVMVKDVAVYSTTQTTGTPLTVQSITKGQVVRLEILPNKEKEGLFTVHAIYIIQ